jgi:hypothetical protein
MKGRKRKRRGREEVERMREEEGHEEVKGKKRKRRLLVIETFGFINQSSCQSINELR